MKKKIYAFISDIVPVLSKIYGSGYYYSLNGERIKDEHDDEEVRCILDKYLEKGDRDEKNAEWEGKLEDKEIQKMFSELDEIFE